MSIVRNDCCPLELLNYVNNKDYKKKNVNRNNCSIEKVVNYKHWRLGKVWHEHCAHFRITDNRNYNWMEEKKKSLRASFSDLMNQSVKPHVIYIFTNTNPRSRWHPIQLQSTLKCTLTPAFIRIVNRESPHLDDIRNYYK